MEVQEVWSVLKNVQEQAAPLCHKVNWWGRRWMWTRELFVRFQEKKTKKKKNFLTNTLIVRGGLRRISLPSWMWHRT